MSNDRDSRRGPAGQQVKKGPRCPLCGQPRVHRFRPFCSARCRDVDLARWFGEAYAVPAVEPGYDDEDNERDERG
jgi:endogenous inhibitor of DNA gyrase (YacG/DUF329 family)